MSLVSKPAPKFELEAVSGGEFTSVKLEELAGKWVVLFFYPLDFTFVCPTEIKEFSAQHEQFEKLGAQVLSASVDSKYSHLAWQKHELGEIAYPMLSDITKRVSRAYGVLLEEEGCALRGLFIIDPEGIVRYEVVHELDVGRNVEETLRVLQALQSGGLCPVNWQPGEATLEPA
jgi:peroxiredoxin (alkyl hydroperoxide reductase subunit C)